MNKFLAIDSSNAQEYNDDGEKLMCLNYNTNSYCSSMLQGTNMDVCWHTQARLWYYIKTNAGGTFDLSIFLVSKESTSVKAYL